MVDVSSMCRWRARIANSEWRVVKKSAFHSPFAIRHSLFALSYAKHKYPRLPHVAFQHVAGLAQQVGDIDGGERIGALDHEPIARREALERLAGFQRRQRALQAAHVEDGLGHWGA